MSASSQALAASSPDHPTAALTSTEAAILASANINSPASANPAQQQQDGQGGQPTAAAAGSTELARTKISLLGALRRCPDFPIPGINFIDILPLFKDPTTHLSLVRALELQTLEQFPDKPDVVVGLEARGFLVGPSLALRLDAGFVPVRKKGKLPGQCIEATYEKEYGVDYFEMQVNAIEPGQKVLVIDDIIATGGSAAAAGSLVKQLGGDLVGFLFILEIPSLKGRDKLYGRRTVTLLETDD